MKNIWSLIVIVLLGPTFIFTGAFASTLKILNRDLAHKVTYTAAEMDSAMPIPYLVHDGRIIQTQEAKKLVTENKTVCMLWAFNLSDNNSLEIGEVKNKALEADQLPLWKDVRVRLLFLNPATDFGLTYYCISKNQKGQPDEAIKMPVQELNQLFANIIQIEI